MTKYTVSLIALVPIALSLAGSGCATKKFVITETGVVNQRVSQVQTEANSQITALAAKEQTDISRVEERIATTDNKISSVATTAEKASTSAAQANSALQQVQANGSQMSAELAKLAATQNYTLKYTGNAMFDLNSSELSDDARAGLDVMIQKAGASRRSVFEIVGFTDKTGSKRYNLALSQKRAEAVARYLVRQQVPMKNISLIGLGEEQTPEQLAAEVQTIDPNANDEELRSVARRVRIRLYVAGADETVASR